MVLVWCFESFGYDTHYDLSVRHAFSRHGIYPGILYELVAMSRVNNEYI